MERLIKIGSVEPRHARDIQSSRLSIDFPKLDRNVFDPAMAYDQVAASGVKGIRVLAGWIRSETVKGVYDFSWLDEIVDNLRERGMRPWITAAYGNPLYDENARKYYGAVGCPPIFTEEQKTAWKNFVTALASHFKGRVSLYEVWNEPDGQHCWKHGPNPVEYGAFAAETARAIKAADPAAKVMGGVVCRMGLDFIDTALRSGMAEQVDAVSFHIYTPDETFVFRYTAALRGVCDSYRPGLGLVQAETGTQSRSDGKGAMNGGAWTPLKQCKFLARHTIADLSTEVLFSSYFAALDVIKALNGFTGQKDTYLDYGYFGILESSFNEDGYACGTLKPKPSYRTMQTITSIFREEYSPASLLVLFTPQAYSKRLVGPEFFGPAVVSRGFKKPNGSSAFVYWNSTDVLTTTFEAVTSLQVANLGEDIKLVDLLTGDVYRLPGSMIERMSGSCLLLKGLPITDAPLMLTFGDFIG